MRRALLALALVGMGGCASSGDDIGALPIDATVSDQAIPPDACSTATELCNGVDDNCDGVIDEGFNLNQPCSKGLGVCQKTGHTICSGDGKSVVCDAIPGNPGPKELCGNGLDDNCDGLVDEGYAALGKPCTNGVGGCQRTGKYVCAPDKLGLVCDAIPGNPGPELCGNGIDDNCNGVTDEGFPDLGTPCDGPDQDFCKEGVMVCASSGLATVCNDNTGNNTELCDGIDNDCNAATVDGWNDPRLGAGCHGPNADCNLGVYNGCSGGVLQCSDNSTESTTNDINNCGTCGNHCTNGHGTTTCSSSACTPACDWGWQSCNGTLNDGCEYNRVSTDTCPGNAWMGSVRGDNPSGGNDVIHTTGFTSWWYRANIAEDQFTVFGSTELTASIFLNTPANVDFDLYVYCYGCGGTLVGSSTKLAGQQERVDYRKEDNNGDDSADILIEVRYYGNGSLTACNNWDLYVYGNTPVGPTTCF